MHTQSPRHDTTQATQRNPFDRSKPLLDFSLAMLLTPAVLMGTTVGARAHVARVHMMRHTPAS